MNPLDSPVMSVSAMAGSILVAALTAAPGHRLAAERRGPAATTTLKCRVEKHADHSSLLRLTYTGVAPLPGGSRFAWAELGTPAAQGAVGVLPQTLAGGESVTLPVARAFSGAGCTAVVLE